jgi:hypothetical protein
MRRYERASMLLTSNRPVEDWGKLLGDAAAVGAMLDRLLHHGHLLQCGHAVGAPRPRCRPDEEVPCEPCCEGGARPAGARRKPAKGGAAPQRANTIPRASGPTGGEMLTGRKPERSSTFSSKNEPGGGSEAIRRQASFLMGLTRTKQQVGKWKTCFWFSSLSTALRRLMRSASAGSRQTAFFWPPASPSRLGCHGGPGPIDPDRRS